MAAIEVSPIEVLALKKLALINGALAQTLTGQAGIEQTALLSVLMDVVGRADLANRVDKPAARSSADTAVEHVLNAIRDDGRKAYLLGFGSQSFELLTEAYAERHGLNVEAFRKEFWSRCSPQSVVVREDS